MRQKSKPRIAALAKFCFIATGGAAALGLFPTDAHTQQFSAISIDPVVAQQMGVRTDTVKFSSISRNARAIGDVVVAENKLSVVNLRFSGWVEKIHVDETGAYVDKGQALFEVYSPELISAQGEYLLALRSSGAQSALAQTTKNRLIYWDLEDSDIKQIEKSRNIVKRVTVRAPASGYVLEKNIVLGAHIKAGTDVYKMGDLESIWVNAEVYEFDAPWVEVGQKATMELTFERGREFLGRVTYVYPTLNKNSRTLRVRLEFPNPDLRLKPGMFATVRIQVEPKSKVLVIPTEAIIHSGERELVFVSSQLGHYKANEIVTGLVSSDGLTEVRSGLAEGEEVVLSGQFLLDSESQLREAVQKLLDSRLQAKKAGNKSSQDAAKAGQHVHTYWTCPMHPQIIQEGPGQCPICNMDLVEKQSAKPTPADDSKEEAKGLYWTCGMHPHVIQEESGICPICNMDLVEKSR